MIGNEVAVAKEHFSAADRTAHLHMASYFINTVV